MKLFTGCFTHAIDAKNRVSVPRKILEVLRQLESAGEVVLTTGLDGCLFLYTPDEFARMSEAVDGAPMGEESTREFSRTFYSSAEPCSVDKNGRMLLPDTLRRLIDVGDKVLFAGVGRRVELWNPEAWAARQAESQSQYENQAKDVFR